MSGWLAALEELRPNEEWSSVSRVALIAWVIAYALFLLYAATTSSPFLFLDYANLVFHEMGHPAFHLFGNYILGILGGTLMELLVPLAFAAHFWWRRHTLGVAFGMFWFFENFLYIATYMADARRLALPLVGSGEHDWEILFGYWGVLQLDLRYAAITRSIGWLGMVSTAAALVVSVLRRPAEPAS
jgi:hypothetical protein